MKSVVALSACVLFCHAGNAFQWPTDPETGCGLTGNMASNDSDGWNGDMPDGTGVAGFSCPGTYTAWLNNGAELFLSPSVYMRNDASHDESHVTLEVYGDGTHLRFNTLSMGNEADRADSSMRLYAHDNAIISVSSQFSTKGKNCCLDFRSGATFDVSAIPSNVGVWLTGGGGDASTGVGSFTVTNFISFTDSCFKGSKVQFGYKNNWETCPVYLRATNSSFEFSATGNLSSRGTYFFTNCLYSVAKDAVVEVHNGATVVFDGGVITNGRWSVGSADASTVDPPESSLVFKRGAKAVVQSLSGGASVNGVGRILVTGQGTDFAMVGDGNKYGYTDLGYSGECYIEIADGAVFRTGYGFYKYMPVRLGGDNAGSYGEMTVDGGECVMTNTYGLYVGAKGDGALYVKDGTARFNKLTVGQNGASGWTKPAVVGQTGGLIMVDNGGAIDNSANNVTVIAYVERPSEVRLEGGVFETGAIYSGNKEYATLVGDGGTLRRGSLDYVSNYEKEKKFIYGLSAVQCGVDALTIDSNGKDIVVDNDFTNISKTEGVMVKTGPGSMTLTFGSYDVAKTVVEEGTLLLGSASCAMQTDLAVTNGAVLSMVGDAASLTLDGLIIDSGTLALDPGDRIVVTGELNVNRLRVLFSETPAVGAEFAFLEVSGGLSADQMTALRHAFVANALENGTHEAFIFSYDSSTDKTTITVSVEEDVPLADTTRWIGVDGQWNADGNWSSGLPSASRIAEFTAGSASAEVTLAPGAEAGALSFGGQDYTISGAPLSIPSESGEAKVTVSSGSQKIDTDVSAGAVVDVSVAGGSSLEFSGQINGGGMKKTGAGRLILASDNTFMRPVGLEEGITTVKTSGAFGAPSGLDGFVTVSAGTLETTNAADSAVTISQDILVAASNVYEPVVFKTETDTGLGSLSVTQGALLKHGKGRLVIPAKDGRTLVPNNWSMVLGNVAMQYSDDGSVDPKTKTDDSGMKWYYAPLTVSEGELVLKGEGDRLPVETVNGDVIVGRYIGKGAAGDSSMTIDGMVLSMPSRVFYLGWAMSDNGDPQHTVLRILNGGKLEAARVVIGEYCFNDFVETLAVTNGTVKAAVMHCSGWLSRPTRAAVAAKDSVFDVGTLLMSGAGNGDFDRCCVGAESGVDFKADATSYTTGQYVFRNGSILNVNGVVNMQHLNKPFAFKFGNSTWKAASSITLDSTTATSCLSVSTIGSGETFTLDVAEGAEFRFADTVALTGDGGFRKAGKGTVSFGPGMYKAAGDLSCAEGVLDLSSAGTLTNITICAGAGIISGATFRNASISLGALGGAVPTFRDCAFTGRTELVIDGEARRISDVKIADYSGSISGLDTFRVSGWAGYKASLSAEDGEVSLSCEVKSLIMIVR